MWVSAGGFVAGSSGSFEVGMAIDIRSKNGFLSDTRGLRAAACCLQARSSYEVNQSAFVERRQRPKTTAHMPTKELLDLKMPHERQLKPGGFFKAEYRSAGSYFFDSRGYST
ncbi:MAG: hypothetical protein EON54_13085 [Alcaligenaceae bacterium]|nr:MAG: hypothetical protein EON54_13085 [Alcaligenaceae bacterium]